MTHGLLAPYDEGYRDGYLGTGYNNSYAPGSDDYAEYDEGYDDGKAAR